MKKNRISSLVSASTGPPKPIALPPPATASQVQAESAGSYDVFKLCIERARNLVKIHQAAHGNQSRPEGFLADAHRAAIVLSVSALDAYVRTACLERIRIIIADKSRELPNALSAEIK